MWKAIVVHDTNNYVFFVILKTQYVNDLSMTIDLEETLQDAEILYRRLECLANKVDAKRLELEQGSTSSSGIAPESSTTVPELPPTLRRLLTQKQ